MDDDFDYADLVWHEVEFREGLSFGYALRDAGGRYVGCAYLYPMGVRTEITEELVDHDVDASWWVTEAAYSEGYYERVYAGLRRWVTADFSFANPFWSNREIPEV